jgi:SAM-dependent methyltransferase
MKKLQKNYIKIDRINNATKKIPLGRILFGALLSFVGLLKATLNRGPGVAFHLAIALKASSLFFRGLPLRQIYRLIFAPMDTVRYFEFDFFWDCLSEHKSFGRYLDISSPRLFTLRALSSGRVDHAVIANPDKKDLDTTIELYEAAGVSNLCEFRCSLVSDLSNLSDSFDTVVCISVLEHIPTDAAADALRSMWALVRPGGKLLLSVPCCANGYEEYLDFDEYGLLQADDSGFIFGQRFYDQEMIESDIYGIVGEAKKFSIFGEKVDGTFVNDRNRKLTDPHYPFWLEASTISSEYAYFQSIQSLPGLGVIACEFIKP